MVLIPIPPKRAAAPPDKGEQEGARGCGVDPTFVVECFNILVGCTHISGAQVMAAQGREQFAAAFAVYFAYTFHRLSVTDPASSIIMDLCERYKTIFPPTTNSGDTPFHRTLTVINAFIAQRWDPNQIWRDASGTSYHECISLARYMVSAARVGYHRVRMVPGWILRLALDSLSLDPQPPTFIITCCITALAIDMGCDVSDITTLNERYICASFIGIHSSDQGPVPKSSASQTSSSRNSKQWLKLGIGI